MKLNGFKKYYWEYLSDKTIKIIEKLLKNEDKFIINKFTIADWMLSFILICSEELDYRTYKFYYDKSFEMGPDRISKGGLCEILDKSYCIRWPFWTVKIPSIEINLNW